MIHKYQLFGNNIVLDIYSGSVHVVSDAVYDLLGEYEFDESKISEEITQKYSEEVLSEAVEEILELKQKRRNAKANMEIVKNSSREVTNVDLLRRISELEKIVYGDR